MREMHGGDLGAIEAEAESLEGAINEASRLVWRVADVDINLRASSHEENWHL